MAIHFYSAEESIKLKLKEKRRIKDWLAFVIKNEKHSVGEINYILCTDEYLLTINKDFLNHDTYTDVITFDYTENKIISGEIYISIERIKENALKYNVETENELNRVMVHGLLHLLGYKDKTKSDKVEITNKENFYLEQKVFHVEQYANTKTAVSRGTK